MIVWHNGDQVEVRDNTRTLRNHAGKIGTVCDINKKGSWVKVKFSSSATYWYRSFELTRIG